MDGLALLCNLHADGPRTLRRLRRAGLRTLAEVERAPRESLAGLLHTSGHHARRFLVEAQLLRRRLEDVPPEPPVEIVGEPARERTPAAAGEPRGASAPARRAPIPVRPAVHAFALPPAASRPHAHEHARAAERALAASTTSRVGDPFGALPRTTALASPAAPARTPVPAPSVPAPSVPAPPVPAKVVRPEPPRPAPAPPATARPEPARPEPARPEPARPEPAARSRVVASPPPAAASDPAPRTPPPPGTEGTPLRAGQIPGLDAATVEKLVAQGVRTYRSLIELACLPLARRAGLPYTRLLDLRYHARRFLERRLFPDGRLSESVREVVLVPQALQAPQAPQVPQVPEVPEASAEAPAPLVREGVPAPVGHVAPAPSPTEPPSRPEPPGVAGPFV